MMLLMLYTCAVGALLGVAAAGAERALRLYRLPGRWVWAAAIAATVAAPLLGPRLLATGEATGDEASIALGAPVVSAAAQVPAAARAERAWLLDAAAVAGRLDGAARAAWLLSSAVGAVFLIAAVVRLRRRRRAWRPESLNGVDVLVSADTGPALVGVLRSAIVMPQWALEVEEPLRGLMLAHEQEHRRAGDPRVLFGALAALVLMPWNPALWWQVRRLRLGVEVDCDARVLRARPDVRGYGELLLRVGGRASGARLLAAFSEPRSLLERRIEAMTRKIPKRRAVQAAALAGSAALVLAVACEVPAPMAPEPEGERGAQPQPAAVPTELTERPVFTPYTVAPELENPREVGAALEAAYPPLLREAGVGGEVHVWLLVDASGGVVDARINRSSGEGPLDMAALKVAERMRFRPAQNRGVRVPVWISLPVVFGTPPTPAEARERMRQRMRRSFQQQKKEEAVRPLAPAAEGDPAEGPVFTPYTVAPELRNIPQVRRALEANYPPLLRDAGVGGEVRVWFYIDRTGTVRDVRISQSSGHGALDIAALRVAQTMEFTPALNREEAVAVWVRLPITFRPPSR